MGCGQRPAGGAAAAPQQPRARLQLVSLCVYMCVYMCVCVLCVSFVCVCVCLVFFGFSLLFWQHAALTDMRAWTHAPPLQNDFCRACCCCRCVRCCSCTLLHVCVVRWWLQAPVRARAHLCVVGRLRRELGRGGAVRAGPRAAAPPGGSLRRLLAEACDDAAIRAERAEPPRSALDPAP